ncbi:4-alpha-glucanotransferase [Magnetospirillum molischianum]|uniref:4-alpha-glucanotransferase n=1 Tax=Magnetospirillum molischianum DSM 120 TaxID=1150626 RepID=H8FRM3_MAGML|nr:4-alpha-glucanotransferase [Magnetospirillum molischianum]CCG41011.1 4-alpha-glucanotransferase [Magnetospirillum molischianum DSM 120]
MTGISALDRLATLAGIEDGWWDFFGQWRVVPPDTKRVFLAAMGFPAADEAEVAASLTELETRPWRRWIEPVLVLEEGSGSPSITVTLPVAADRNLFSWTLEEELGIAHRGSFYPADLGEGDGRSVDGVDLRRRSLLLPALPPIGYHRLTLTGPDGVSAEQSLIVAPSRAYTPPVVAQEPGAWGIATQIYALRSSRDWGLGGYDALAELAEGAAKLGASCIGVNPLHALFPTQPERFSPYAPSSRMFLNTAYIDIEAVPEFADCREARRLFAAPAFQALLGRAREPALVDYETVARLSRPILEALFRAFRQSGDFAAFEAFRQAGGERARQFALFEALHERMIEAGTPYWRTWPEDLRHPDAAGVARFAAENSERIDFFHWLQFVADSQLARAHRAGLDAGAPIGLYRDLAVGIAGDGGDSWLEQDSLALGVSVGAPPDPLALKGQDWGLLPFNPLALYERAFAPFIAVMRANMRHAGALRLDHAMALQRLYWVPPGFSADQGAYVRYPVEDLFRLVALESRRNRCLVIGEDLGTVPDGFRERMEKTGIFAYRVMVFEKESADRFRPSDQFDAQALAIFATHDLPSARSWWLGHDIDRREELDLYPRPGQADEERGQRVRDRVALIATLSGEGLLSADFSTEDDVSDDRAVQLAAAAHAFLGRSRSRLTMVQIEDVLGLDLQMNLPGTTTEHPNWRCRYPRDIAEILADERIRSLAEGFSARDGRRDLSLPGGGSV